MLRPARSIFSRWAVSLESCVKEVKKSSHSTQMESLVGSTRNLYRESNLSRVEMIRMDYVLGLPKGERSSTFSTLMQEACNAGYASTDGIAILSEMHMLGINGDKSVYHALMNGLVRSNKWQQCAALFSYYLDSNTSFPEDLFRTLCESIRSSGRWELVLMAMNDIDREIKTHQISEDVLMSILHALRIDNQWLQAIRYVVPWVLQRSSDNPSQRFLSAFLISAYNLRHRCPLACIDRLLNSPRIIRTLSPQNLNFVVQLYTKQWNKAMQIYTDNQLNDDRKETAFISLMRILSASRQWVAGFHIFRGLKQVPTPVHRMNLSNCLAFNGMWKLALSQEVGMASIFEYFRRHSIKRSELTEERTGIPEGMRSLLFILSVKHRWSEGMKLFSLCIDLSKSMSSTHDKVQTILPFKAKEVNFLIQCCTLSSRSKEALQVLNTAKLYSCADIHSVALLIDTFFVHRNVDECVESYNSLLEQCRSLRNLNFPTLWKLLYLMMLESMSTKKAKILSDIEYVISSQECVDEINNDVVTEATRIMKSSLKKFPRKEVVETICKIKSYVRTTLGKRNLSSHCEYATVERYFSW